MSEESRKERLLKDDEVEEVVGGAGNGTFKCLICNETFTDLISYTNHLDTHDGQH